MNKLSARLLAGVVCLIIAGCTVSTKDTIVVGPPQRSTSSEVENNTGFSGERQAIPSSIAILPFTNITDETVAGPLLRQVINSQLSGRNFAIMHPAEVDKRLPNGPLDHTQMASYLGVEGILVGEVVDFERFFAGVYSEIRLGIKLSLYNTAGDIVWTGEHDVTQRAGGISTTAWGLLLNAAIAAMNLDDENLLAAADELGRKVALDFPQPRFYKGGNGPDIESVIHDKADKWLRYGDVIEVGVKGEAGLQAFVEIGDQLRTELDEVEPGIYIRKIPVQPDWNQRRVPVTGILQDTDGSTNSLLSITGLVNFDNVAPEAVIDLVGSQTESVLKLAWEGDEDSAEFIVSKQTPDGQQVLQQSADSFVNLEMPTEAFSKTTYTVVAVDKAGNTSQPKTLTLTAYIKEVGKQTFLSGPLQGDYNGILSLTKTFSPYQVKGKVTFSTDSELYVEPGVKFEYDPGASIEIQGEAYFWGLKETISIVALGDTARRQPYLVLNNTKPTQISGLKLTQPGMGIVVKSGQPLLESIEIVGSRFTAISIEGEANVTLRHCLIDGSNTSGVVVSDYAKLNMTDCSLSNNFPFHIQNASSYAVEALDNNWQPAASPSSILGKVRTK